MHRLDFADATQKLTAKGSNQSGLRAYNERLLLSILRREGAMAKADIARATELSAQTVSNIMRALEEDGLIVKGEPQRGRVGQPSVPISLAANGVFFWGLKIGRRSIELVLTNFLGQVVGRERQTYAYPTPDSTVDFARSAIERLTGLLGPGDRDRIAGLGIAMPFEIWRWAREINVAPEKMAGWITFDVAGALADVADCPVFLQNDASAACGAELVFGEGSRPGSFLYFYIAYFIGGGVVLGNTLYTGPTGSAGAIGPLPVVGPDGRVTQLLEIASLAVLERDIRAAGGDPEMLWRDVENWDVPEETMERWVRNTAACLAQAIVASISVIDFEAVLIDGWMPAGLRSRLVEVTIDRIAEANLTGLILPEIREGTLGPDARSLGAASLPLSERYLTDATG